MAQPSRAFENSFNRYITKEFDQATDGKNCQYD